MLSLVEVLLSWTVAVALVAWTRVQIRVCCGSAPRPLRSTFQLLLLMLYTAEIIARGHRALVFFFLSFLWSFDVTYQTTRDTQASSRERRNVCKPRRRLTAESGLRKTALACGRRVSLLLRQKNANRNRVDGIRY